MSTPRGCLLAAESLEGELALREVLVLLRLLKGLLRGLGLREAAADGAGLCERRG
jgi:hypothetical protein